MRTRFHFLVDEQDLAVRVNVDRPAKRDLSFRGHHAKRFGDFLGRIAEDRVIKLQRFGELLVDVFGVAASCKIRDIELFDGVATLTE